jgi:hypothetical protein
MIDGLTWCSSVDERSGDGVFNGKSTHDFRRTS